MRLFAMIITISDYQFMREKLINFRDKQYNYTCRRIIFIEISSRH